MAAHSLMVAGLLLSRLLGDITSMSLGSKFATSKKTLLSVVSIEHYL